MLLWFWSMQVLTLVFCCSFLLYWLQLYDCLGDWLSAVVGWCYQSCQVSRWRHYCLVYCLISGKSKETWETNILIKIHLRFILLYVARKLHLLQFGQGKDHIGNLAIQSSRSYHSAYEGFKVTWSLKGKKIVLTYMRCSNSACLKLTLK
jgi:hypothetical protein